MRNVLRTPFYLCASSQSLTAVRASFISNSSSKIRKQHNMAHTTFPSDLPVPSDDGACAHLPSTPIPASLSLPSTDGTDVIISTLPSLTILFCYPRTGRPNETIPDDWNSIPGARGCTPQACSFRDASDKLQKLGVSQVFGVSTQGTDYQREVKERLGLKYELLSDERLEFVQTMGLPVFEWEGKKLCKRVTLAVEHGKIIKVFYPVFPPDKSAQDVVDWLESGRQREG